jgi:PKD repeat protein
MIYLIWLCQADYETKGLPIALMSIQSPLHLLFISAVLLLALMLAGCPPGQPPLAEFSADPLYGAAPMKVDFTDYSLPGGANITKWHWDFGDGNTSRDRYPSHVYTATGEYSVQLTASSSAGKSTETKAAYIQVVEAGALFFQVLLKNTGDYPLVSLYIARAGADQWGPDRLPSPLPPGMEIMLSRVFGKDDYMVAAVFEVNGQLESAVIPGNLRARFMPDDMVSIEAFRRNNGEIDISYSWGIH